MIVNPKPASELNLDSEAKRHNLRRREQVVHRIFYNLIWAQGQSVFDIGCGIGMGARSISENGAKTVLALDKDLESIHYCCAFPKMNVTYMQGDFFDFIKHNPDAKFDVCVAIEIVEHVKKYERFLDEIKRITKKTAYISTVINERDTIYSGNFHSQEWTEQEFKDLLRLRWKNVVFHKLPDPAHPFHVGICQDPT